MNMREYLNHYGEIATHLERMSDIVKNAKNDLAVARADALEWMATSNEFKKAADFNCARYHDINDLLTEILHSKAGEGVSVEYFLKGWGRAK